MLAPFINLADLGRHFPAVVSRWQYYRGGGPKGKERTTGFYSAAFWRWTVCLLGTDYLLPHFKVYRTVGFKSSQIKDAGYT